jgi:hypothetical protein
MVSQKHGASKFIKKCLNTAHEEHKYILNHKVEIHPLAMLGF